MSVRGAIGMVHVGALPGTPRAHAAPAEIVAAAVAEARALAEAGFDGIIVENMHDRPYLRDGIGPEVVACMAVVAAAVRRAVEVPLGIQILGGGAVEALSVAHAAGLEFIRCENFVFAHTADEGVMDRAVAGPLLRHRRAIGAERVAVLADIKKKHAAHALTANLDIAECARGAAFFLADGVVVTGTETGAPVAMDELRRVRAAVALPVVVGSGATPDTVADLLAHADAVIVGSWIKRGGAWTEPVDPDRAAAFVAAARRARTPDGAPAPDRATHRASAQPAAAPTAAPAATPAAPGVDAVRSLFPRR